MKTKIKIKSQKEKGVKRMEKGVLDFLKKKGGKKKKKKEKERKRKKEDND